VPGWTLLVRAWIGTRGLAPLGWALEGGGRGASRETVSVGGLIME